MLAEKLDDKDDIDIQNLNNEECKVNYIQMNNEVLNSNVPKETPNFKL